MGAVDGAGERLEQVAVGGAVEPAQRLHRGAAGDVAAGRAADAVGDHEQVRAGVPGVLVVLADPADVGERGVAQRQRGGVRRRRVGGAVRGDALVVVLHVGHGEGRPYFLSSIVVFPIRTLLPSVSVVGWVSRCEPM